MTRSTNDVASSVRLTLSVAEAAKQLRISRNSAYEAIKAGALPSIRIGRRVLVPCAALALMLAGEGAPRGANR